MTLPTIPTPVTAALSAGWAFIKKFYREIAIVLLLLGCYHLNSRAIHWHDQTQICQTGREADRKAYEAAAAKARADNLATVRQTELKWQGVVSTTETNLNAQLASAYAIADSYARRMREALAAPAKGGTSGPGVSQTSGPASGIGGAGGNSLIPVPADDLRICAANTVKAKGWQDFYAGVRAAQPEARKPNE